MVKDVQLLEKKVNILKDSVIQVNKAFYKYEKDVDMKDLMDQVTDMVHRTEKKEQDALEPHATDEQAVSFDRSKLNREQWYRKVSNWQSTPNFK